MPNPSKIKNPKQEPQKSQNLSNNSTVPWTFGYPQCINKKQSRLVCLHANCQKYPFFCSACEDESCQNQHLHPDKISSIGFKQLIKRLITERKPPQNLQNSVKAYKKSMQQLLKNVTQFVQTETASMDQILKKTTEIQEEDEKVIANLKEKKYQEIKGKQLDSAWNKVAETEHKKKLQKQMIEFIDSKKVQIEEMTNHFRDGLKVQNKSQGQVQKNSTK